jgi:uncharacterized protein (DUF305 family)
MWKNANVILGMSIVAASGCATEAPPESIEGLNGDVEVITEELGMAGAQASQQGHRCRTFHIVIKDERAPFIPDNDIDLIDALVPHHEMALMMAEMEIAEGANPEVVALAQRMRDMQMQEIAELRAMREEITGCDSVPPLRDRHGDADMAELQAASGVELDRLFLEHMIPHHASAINFSHNALPNLTREDLREMAMSVVENQSAEIAEMLDLKAML